MAFLFALSLALQKLPAATIALPPARAPGPGPASGIVTAAAVVLAATALLPLTSESWYRWRESLRAPVDTWTLAPAPPDVPEEPLGERVESMLGYDEGFRRRWTDAGSRSLDLIYMRWLPGRKALGAGPHAPDVCQRAIGREVTHKSPVRMAKFGQAELPYQIYTIEDRNRTFYLLFALDDGYRDPDWLTSGLMHMDTGNRMRRLRRAFEGNRDAGQSALQIALVGETDPAVAERELLAVLQELVVERQP